MKSMFFKKVPLLIASAAATFCLFACSDDSNSTNDPVIPPLEQPTDSIANPPAPNDPASSSSELTCDALIPECGWDPIDSLVPFDPPAPSEPPAASVCPSGETPVPAVYPMDDFTDIGDVYKNIQCNEKVIFVLRHAERDADTGLESHLTMDGVEAALKAGQKIAGEGEFKFIHSGFLRTYQTAYYISIGRGQYQPSPAFADSVANWTVETEFGKFVAPADFAQDTIKELADGWYLKDKDLRDQYKERDSIGNVNLMLVKWIYEGMYQDVFYDLEERSKEILGYLVKDYSEMPKFSLAASHDQLLMPLVSWATDKKINLIFRDPNKTGIRWLTFLAGLAIIINDKNEVRYVPVRGMDSGYGR